MRRHRINREIRAPKVRLVHEGEQTILAFSVALAKAMDLGLDLVEVSPNADPPVCKIMDFRKVRFGEERKQRELKKKTKSTQ